MTVDPVTPSLPPLFLLCQRWMLAIGVLSLLLGLFLMVGTGTPIFAGYNATIAKAFFNTTELTPELARYNAWAMATIGAGTVGWAVAFIYLAAVPFKRREKWAHQCFVVSIGVWVLLDVAAALWFGVTGEVVFISVTGVGLSIPLILSRRFF